MTTKYIPWEVYTNLKKFLEYRNVQSETTFIQEGEFANIFNHYGYAKISGRRDDKYGNRSFHILLIAPNNHYASKSPNFKKLLNMIPSSDITGNSEIVVISETPLTNFIKSHIAEKKAENKLLYIEHYTYEYFSTVLPNQISIPKHSIPSQEEVTEFCSLHRTKKQNFPKIYTTDSQVVWLGLRAGDVVEVDRKSYAVGEFPLYRYVIRK